MKVTLIEYTNNSREILIFAKSTRLGMTPKGFKDIVYLPEKDKKKEIDYAFGTIKSSLEFIDYIILYEDVTRAFTHQLVRHRVGVSFAQQSQRTVDVSEFNYYVPNSLDSKNKSIYEEAMQEINNAYVKMIHEGTKPEDARGILPTNIYTNILMKINLRALSEMMSSRLCNRAQKEFRDAMIATKEAVINIHPWTESILKCYCEIHEECFFKNKKGCGKYNEKESK